MGIKVSIFVIHYKGDPIHGMMYGDFEGAKESAKEFRSRSVEIKKETFDESEIYFAGDHPDYGPVYATLAEINKTPVPWSEKFKPTKPLSKLNFFDNGKPVWKE